jgi:hypothetical protein
MANTKQKNPLETVTLSLSVTPGIFAFITRLMNTHFYGRSENETAAQILSAEVKRLVMMGELDSMASKSPTTVAARTEEGSTEENQG